ncbi:response regulator transcription factor [Candidatus Nomurabacteria bacterium]|nr:response regulator transcription factor [Candidatus Nomurabacteria bacterium]USN94515.1 MAG: response regulator transcription factor [Candidatus Nomurabacteria bacterium]
MSKVLIVEDDAFLQGIMATKLSKEGFVIVTADSAEEGKNKLEESPDIIILDLLLPEGDGFQVMEVMREKGMKTPVIVFSNLNTEKDFKRAQEFDMMREYMVKSNFTLEELIEKMHAILG